MKKVYLDLWSLNEEKDIKRWLDEFSFPIPHSTYLQIKKEVKDIFDSLINNHPDEELGDILIIQYKLTMLLSNVLYFWLIYDKLRNENGNKMQFSDKDVFFNFFTFKGELNDNMIYSLISPFSNLHNLKTTTLKWPVRVLLTAKRSKYWFKYNFPQFLFRPVIDRRVVTIYPQHIVIEYFKRNKISVFPELQEYYLDEEQFRKVPPISREVENMVKDILEDYKRLAKDKFGSDVPEKIITALERIMIGNLEYILKIYRMVKGSVTRKRIRKFYRLSGGNSFIRMFGLAVIRAGGESIGFKHGEPILYDLPFYNELEFSTVSKFNFYSERTGKLAGIILRKHPLYRKNKIELGSAETKEYFNFYKKRPPFEKIYGKKKNIMLIGNFYKGKYVCEMSGIHDMILIELDLRIIKSLKNKGWNVLYKPHPERMDMTGLIKKIFSQCGVDIVEEPFEDVMDESDIYFFTHTRTTTIGYAIASNKPIVALKLPWEPIIQEQYKSLQKRIHFIKAWEDERGRIIFNEDELLEAVSKKPEEPNTEFLEKYMFPKNKE